MRYCKQVSFVGNLCSFNGSLVSSRESSVLTLLELSVLLSVSSLVLNFLFIYLFILYIFIYFFIWFVTDLHTNTTIGKKQKKE